MKMRSPLNIHFCIELSDLPKHWINRELEGKKTFEVEKKTNLFQIKPKVCLQMLSLWMIGTTCSIEENPTSAAIACCHGIKGSWKKKAKKCLQEYCPFFSGVRNCCWKYLQPTLDPMFSCLLLSEVPHWQIVRTLSFKISLRNKEYLGALRKKNRLCALIRGIFTLVFLK